MATQSKFERANVHVLLGLAALVGLAFGLRGAQYFARAVLLLGTLFFIVVLVWG